MNPGRSLIMVNAKVYVKLNYAKEMEIQGEVTCFDQKSCWSPQGEALSLKVVQPAGKPKMSITDFYRRHVNWK